MAKLSLQLLQLDVSSREVETGEGVKLNVRSVCQVKVEASRIGTDGKLVTNPQTIAVKYVRGWFLADACASIPY